MVRRSAAATVSTAVMALILGACSSGGPGVSSASAATPQEKHVMATLAAADGSARGSAMAMQAADGVTLSVELTGLPPGVHGLHVHTVGSCAAPDFASAGGHWNPMMKQHGADNPQGMHMGDLPNVTIGADGKGRLRFTIAGARIGDGPEALLDADGSAIVIHAGPDDMKSDPAGNSGGRIACGVFKAG